MLLMTMLTSLGAWAGTLTHFPIYEGDEGTEAKPYQIKSATDLDYLAEDVNNGTTYEDCYFKVTAPITYTSSDAWNLESSEANNFTAIGNWNKPFKGIFDGNHQTISGIRIYKGGNDFTNDCYLGIFGCIKGSAVVKDITLKNTRITGFCNVAGIVGAIPEETTATVSGCIVGDNVAIHTKAFKTASYSYSHGGIVGLWGSGTVSGCFSAATLTVDNNVSSTNYYNSHGAIVGSGSNGTLSNNYYCGSVNGVFTGVGKGTTNSTTTSDVTENNGALPVHTFTLTNSTTTSATTSAAKVLTYDGKDYYRDGTTVTITVTVPDGNVLNSLTVTDGSSNTVAEGFWYSNNTVSFVPANNVIVSDPTFTSDLTSLYINMPKTGTVNATIPSGVQSFKVYDDGGVGGNYSNNCDGTLVLTVPSGHVMQLSGTISMYPNQTGDRFYVYDGANTSASTLINEDHGVNKTYSAVTSTGNAMTLYFKSYDSDYSGLNLTVTLINALTYHDVTISNPATGGSIESDKSTAQFNETVTLTATPESGKILYGVSVKDGSNNDVAVTQETFSNIASFKMPASDATVTPTFTDATADGGLYVNMPKTGTKTVTIPTIVQSFKVYDDGGAGGTGYRIFDDTGGNYSNNCDGTLVLTAPAGYVLRLSGSIKTENSGDNLTVYDNSAASGSKLLNEVCSSSSGTAIDITPVTSSGQSMTLYFKSGETINYDGLDLTVTLAKDNAVVLADNADNTTVIDDNDGFISTVTLQGRTLYKDGDWNTLCLPFAVTDFTGTPLEGATVKELLTTSNLDNTGKLTLNFSDDLTAIDAGKPYIVKWVPDITSTPIIDPANDVVTALNFISELPTVDGGQATNWGSDEGPGSLVDGKTGKYKYGLSNNDPWVEFHYANAITPKGYALWTASDSEGTRNPRSWTIMAKVNQDDPWTTLVTVDNSNGDKLPMTNDTRTVFALNNTTAYQYFRFEAMRINSGSNSGQFQLAELQFCTVQPTISVSVPDIINPKFAGVTIDKTAPTEVTSTDGNVTFVGQYNPFTIDDSNIKSVILLGSNNKLGYSTGNRTLRSFRAHFFVPATAMARSFELNFGEDGGTTGVFQIENGELKVKTLNSGWYTLGGLKLQGEPTEKGVYIYNGKKVVLK